MIVAAGRVPIGAHYLATIVDPVGKGCGRAGIIKFGEGAISISKTMGRPSSINVIPHDLAAIVDPADISRGAAWVIDHGKDAAYVAEAMGAWVTRVYVWRADAKIR